MNFDPLSVHNHLFKKCKMELTFELQWNLDLTNLYLTKSSI